MAMESSRRGGGAAGVARWIAKSWMAILFFACFFLFWELSIGIFNVPAYILNRPSEIVTNAWADLDRLIAYTGITALETLIGYVIAILAAVPLGLAIAFSSVLRQVGS